MKLNDFNSEIEALFIFFKFHNTFPFPNTDILVHTKNNDNEIVYVFFTQQNNTPWRV